MDGSSPLARGLRLALPDDGALERIIPARAGFTKRRPDRFSRRPGSSPLARGLHGDVSLRHVTRGIIPARAGFTGPLREGPARPRDHPRSRGVYSWGCLTLSRASGSSPLARGLREDVANELPRARIIPARAGFTAPRRAARPPTRDHPRSRGVYCTHQVMSFTAPGSSPLARGLLLVGHGRDQAIGIIPARAGFTRRCPPSRPAPTDHPRSRGVYAHSSGRCAR